MDRYIFWDVESDGLYGSFLSFAMILTDECGYEKKKIYYGLTKEKLKEVKDEWTIKNVIPNMGKYTECEDEESLLKEALAFWTENKENTYLVADVSFPVESRFLERMLALVNYDIETSPYPLLDLASMLQGIGEDPKGDREKMAGILKKEKLHNPCYDADLARRIWRKYFLTCEPPNTSIPYSYHTFIFPFVWNKDKTSRDFTSLTVMDFLAFLRKDKKVFWKPIDNMAQKDSTNDWELYAQMQYFKDDAENIMLLCDSHAEQIDPLVTRLQFCVNGKTNFARVPNSKNPEATKKATGYYLINKGKKVYSLDINQIVLSVFNTGIALLTLETEYWGEAGKTLDAVNQINEHGRRVALPFMPSKEEYNVLAADKIRISIDDKDFYSEEDYLKTIREFHKKTDFTLDNHYIMKPIRDLLFDSVTEEIMEDPRYLECIDDDRMFVCCQLIDNEISSSLCKIDPYENEEIYKFGFIENSISCPTERMRRSILDRCLYTRWLAVGTLDIVTHHSFMRITSNYVKESVIDPFLRMYVKMAELAVLQKATLIVLEEGCFYSDDKQMTALHNKYTEAQKKILLDACTVQEQGVEEFDMLKQELEINQRKDSLDKRLNDLYELANYRHDCEDASIDRANARKVDKLTFYGTIFAIGSLLFDAVGLVCTFCPEFTQCIRNFFSFIFH